MAERCTCRSDPARLAQEVAYLADKGYQRRDVRLSSHLINSARPLIWKAKWQGLDFILKELNREANTVLSNPLTSTSKTPLWYQGRNEKLREQVQNVE